MEEQKGIWLTILDYAKYRDTSISTVRRHIKANRVKHRLVEGRFEIFISEEKMLNAENKKIDEMAKLRKELAELERRVRVLTEANNDLKMLVQIYEGAQHEKAGSHPQERIRN